MDLCFLFDWERQLWSIISLGRISSFLARSITTSMSLSSFSSTCSKLVSLSSSSSFSHPAPSHLLVQSRLHHHMWHLTTTSHRHEPQVTGDPCSHQRSHRNPPFIPAHSTAACIHHRSRIFTTNHHRRPSICATLIWESLKLHAMSPELQMCCQRRIAIVGGHRRSLVATWN